MRKRTSVKSTITPFSKSSGFALLGFTLILLLGRLRSQELSATHQSGNHHVQASNSAPHHSSQLDLQHLDLNFISSKRKVPNGPDPIHNRRAGNSKRPPGRA